MTDARPFSIEPGASQTSPEQVPTSQNSPSVAMERGFSDHVTPHLGDLIAEEMKSRHWTITDLVMNMGPHEDEKAWGICQLSWGMFLSVQDPDVILGDIMAQQLGDAFDVNPLFFTNYHEMWRRETKSSTETTTDG